jgi:hypothetical protein
MPRVELTRTLLMAATGLLLTSASELQAQPTRPPPTREQVAQMAAKREAFCTGIRQLGVLSKTNFRSIDKGFKPGSDIFHASAITLPDATDCYISTIKGETDHSCSFPARVETLAAQTRGMSNLVARCVGAPSPTVTTDEMGTSSQMLVNGVRYAVQSDDFGDGPVTVTVNVQQWNKPLPR